MPFFSGEDFSQCGMVLVWECSAFLSVPTVDHLLKSSYQGEKCHHLYFGGGDGVSRRSVGTEYT